MKKLPWKTGLLILLIGINWVLLAFQFWPEETRPEGLLRFFWTLVLTASYAAAVLLIRKICQPYAQELPSVKEKGPAFLHAADRYRWPAGIFLWILLTMFQLHGSSIGMYSFYLGEPQTSSDLIGFSRVSHFDEWLNMTTFALAQYAAGFAQFNPAFSAVPTDMGLFPGSPTADWEIIFRPFLLGYLFLPPGMGLAFYWTGRLICLFLVSFEFGKFVTHGKKRLALLYAWMIVLSPAVQWWFGVNSLVEMLAAGQAGCLVLHRYFTVRGRRERFLLAGTAAYLACLYGMALYPAWQIPLGYIFLFLAVCPLLQKETGRSPDRTDGLCLLLAAVFTGTVFLYLWHLSGPSIEAIRQTVYPGQRFAGGGGMTVQRLFAGPLSLFMPFAEFSSPYMNFNMASFWDLAPLGWITALWGMIRTKKKDLFLLGLLVLEGFFLLFCFFPWPKQLAEASLLYAVPPGRMIIPLSLINLLLLIRSLALYPLPWSRKSAFPAAAACTVLALWAVFAYCPDAYSLRNGLVLAAVTGTGFLAFLRYRRYMGPYVMGLFLVIGGMVNPVARGVSSVYDTALASQIRAVLQEDRTGRWIVMDKTPFLNNYPAVFGAPVINTFMVHPAWSVWDSLSLTEEDRTVLNRCAHVIIGKITEGPTDMTLQHGDVISMTLGRSDVDRLDIRHILTKEEDLESLDTGSIHFIPRARAGAWIIYDVRRGYF